MPQRSMHSTPATRAACTAICCGSVADELFQDVWMNLIRARASYAPTAKFTTWLYRLARNRLIDHYRASAHLTLVSADDEAHEETVATLPGARSDQPQVRAE